MASYGTTMEILNINQLNADTGRIWTIRAKVLMKSNVIPYFISNSNNGQRFYFHVSDSTGIIRIVAFGDEVDKFYSIIEPNCLYTISGGQIKMSNKNYNDLDHACEIILNNTTNIEKYETCSTNSLHRNRVSAVASSMETMNVTLPTRNQEIEENLKQNEEDHRIILQRLTELDNLDEENNRERQMLTSKIRRLDCEKECLLSCKTLNRV